MIYKAAAESVRITAAMTALDRRAAGNDKKALDNIVVVQGFCLRSWLQQDLAHTKDTDGFPLVSHFADCLRSRGAGWGSGFF